MVVASRQVVVYVCVGKDACSCSSPMTLWQGGTGVGVVAGVRSVLVREGSVGWVESDKCLVVTDGLAGNNRVIGRIGDAMQKFPGSGLQSKSAAKLKSCLLYNKLIVLRAG